MQSYPTYPTAPPLKGGDKCEAEGGNGIRECEESTVSSFARGSPDPGCIETISFGSEWRQDITYIRYMSPWTKK